MARKKSTPYPVQIRRLVASLGLEQRGAFSAKDVYEQLDHPARHDFKSSIGKINQLLHQHWSNGELISFAGRDGTLLREENFVAPGSAAVQHPQIFAANGTRSPKRGFYAITYADHNAGPRPGERVSRESEFLPEPSSEFEREASAAPVGEALEPETAADWPAGKDVDPNRLARFALERRMEAPAPEWLPDALLRVWVTRPQTLAVFRQGLSQAQTAERRQLILTGLTRKGEVRPDSAPAGELVKLCRAQASWWQRCSQAAFSDYVDSGRALPVDELPRLFDDLDELVSEFDRDVVVLTCLRLGIESEDVQVLAIEAGDELGDSAATHVDEELNRLAARLQLAEEETRETQAQLRDERKRRVAAERKLDLVEKRRAGERTKTGSETTQLADLQDKLAEALAEKAALESEKEALLEDSASLAEKETQLQDLRTASTQLESELALAQEKATRHQEVEAQLQDALRTIGELNVRVEQLTADARSLPAPSDAHSLVELLDAGIGSLLAESAERMRGGAAGMDDQQLLAFAAHFVEFKQGLATASRPAAAVAVDDRPEAEAGAETEQAAEPKTTVADTQAPAGEVTIEDAPTVIEPEEQEATPEEAPAAAESMAGGDEPTDRRRRSRLGWVVRPLGGAGEIGGSAILVSTPSGRNVLLDAGQRVRGVYGADGNEFHYGIPGIEQLDAIIVSHAHIDHCGSLPVLHRNQGGRQNAAIPVYMSEPTRALAEVMMHDSAKIQHARERDLRELGESDWDAEMFASKPAYNDEEVRRVLGATEQVAPFVNFEIPTSGISARFEPVAHVLGSCAVHLTDQESGATLLYTGDLGPISDQQLTLPDFGIDQLTTADVVLMESTYGKPNPLEGGQVARKAPETRRQREIARFYKLAAAAFERGGFVLVPCFSLGRAQEIVRLIFSAPDRTVASKRIYIGGMAERILETYTAFAERGERDRGIRWVTSGQFPRTTSLHSWLEPGRTYAEIAHELLTEHEPGFVIASPATMTGGWSQTFANEMIDDPSHAVIFSGFLPRDDRVAVQLSSWKKGSTYRLDGSKRTIQCDWERVGLSAHAPAADLRMFARRMAEKASGPVSFLCVHGLPEAQRMLAEDIARYENVSGAREMLNAQSWTLKR